MTSDATFETLHRAADAACGARLFTVTVVDREAGVARRAYSSHPSAYPVTGTKPMGCNAWKEQVIDRGETFVANETEAFSPYFSDHALINDLGCEAAVNIPVMQNGHVVGTVNILDAAGRFTPERTRILEQLVANSKAELLQAFASIPMEDQS